jgi:hypothetical protein
MLLIIAASRFFIIQGIFGGNQETSVSEKKRKRRQIIQMRKFKMNSKKVRAIKKILRKFSLMKTFKHLNWQKLSFWRFSSHHIRRNCFTILDGRLVDQYFLSLLIVLSSTRRVVLKRQIFMISQNKFSCAMSKNFLAVTKIEILIQTLYLFLLVRCLPITYSLH